MIVIQDLPDRPRRSVRAAVTPSPPTGPETSARTGHTTTPGAAVARPVHAATLADTAARTGQSVASTRAGQDAPHSSTPLVDGQQTASATEPPTATRRVTTTGSSTRPQPSPSGTPIRRGGLLAAAAAVLLAATAITAPTAAATAGDSNPAAAAAITENTENTENTAARTAIEALTSPDQATAAIPADFAAGAGYQPTIEQGLLVNPDGECSSPVPLPAEFEITCKAHDLGYDLLRYADSRGQPLTAWARQALDATFEQRMHAACTTRANTVSRTGCQAMASIANTFVDLNSRRQGYGPPVNESRSNTTESEPRVHAAAAIPVAGSALAFAGFAARSTRRRLNHTAPQEVSA
ncbi:hypothetical protein HLB23_22350 [Nocardia uniformis]|uniref:Uncharacterized protein n=1 Tax=Nocardia uniformis TaxID=53432 RepID=A0A849C9I5_9NOCA|nr:hypothetical protein [Nocardia uniformis]NNH72567.1 hypothetical protein [Nocardia uniformis]